MSLPHLLLGLLSVNPLSGYDLNKQFNTSLQHFWTTDQSQIYRALHRMKADGWVTIERVAQSNNPDKKIYHLTEAGRAALHDWLRTPLEDEPPREAWLGQLFFAHNLTPTEVGALIDGYDAYLRATIVQLEGLHHFLEPERKNPDLKMFFRLSTLDYGLARYRFELGWLEQLRDRIAKHFPD